MARRGALWLLFGALLAGAGGWLRAAPAAVTLHICIDQFGYLPAATKIAVIANPQVGYNAGDAYVPGATLQVRNWDDDSVVLEAAPAAWNNGATDAISGDQCWWFDFSSLTTPGRYYIWDPANGKGSAQFQVGPDIYRAAAIQAMRSYFYQRCGHAKLPPFAAPQWSDTASFLGPNQDTACRLVTDPGNAATAQDLHGGWADAGDYNKYTNFARGTVQNLLLAYEDHPSVWGEDHGIPESGNGIPDILNEVKWEVDWLLRMQQPDGSLLSKVSAIGVDSGSPPSTDTAARYYGAASTSSTLTGADIFAHAAIVFGSLGQPAATAYAATLRTAAINAWNWAAANPSVIYDNAGFTSADPEGETTPAEHAVSLARAACMLFALTGDTQYRDVFDANYTQASVFTNPYYLSPYDADVHSALFYYLRIPNGTPAVKTAIANAFLNGVSQLPDFLPAATSATDPYRAYLAAQDYTWGSNQTKSMKGGIFLWIVQQNLAPANANAYLEAAAGFLHYLHGTNPLGLVFLSNMGAYGATNSASQFYHSWFGSGPYSSAEPSPAAPAPGYLTGGPDLSYAPDPSYTGPLLAPPLDQPAMKSYKNWNIGWPQDSWEVTENAIYYEAAYIRLLSAFLAPDTSVTPTITAQPASQSITTGGTAQFAVSATGPGTLTYQWCFDGVPLSGATNATLSLSGVAATQAGAYTVVVGSGTSLITSATATLTVTPGARLLNLSARADVAASGSNPQVLIAGFVIGGSGSKSMLVRGIGPALAGFAVSDPLALPELTLFDGGSAVIATNSGWGSAPQPGASPQAGDASAATAQLFSQVGAFALTPGSADSALAAVLPSGSYTAQVSGQDGSTGVALAELYDADTPGPASRLVNISARAVVDGGTQTLMAGFVVSSGTTETVLLRGIGPALSQFGVAGSLPSPELVLYDGSGQIIATNTGWGNAASLGPSALAPSAGVEAATPAIMSSVGAFALPAGSADCALVATLPPGKYTVEVQGVAAAGIALAEVYEIP
ncbi:MAG TPA: glycoside hydrolase family 9 protein [Opitutaceae bacterium]|jgi:hypothetical protein|nr:glycoside hydrolase family 9 protein [Opitutaceae bacterium]